jgi:acyl dehydratase
LIVVKYLCDQYEGKRMSDTLKSSPEESPHYARITQEALDQSHARTGRVVPITQPFLTAVNPDSIGHVARGLGDDNGLWADADGRASMIYGAQIAPPAWLYGAAWSSWDLRRGEGLPGIHAIHAGDTWHYFRPVLSGDTIHATKEQVSVTELQGSYAGRTIKQQRLLRFFNQNDDLVATQLMSVIRPERDAAKKNGKYASLDRARYTAEEIAAIDREIDSQTPRGAEELWWDDIAVGDAIPTLTKGPLGVHDFMAWMMGVGTPHVRSGRFWLEYRTQSPSIAVPDPRSGVPASVERVHWDDFMAAEIGMPAPYDYGPQRGGFASQLMTNWIGDHGFLESLDVQYRHMVFVDDLLRYGGEVERTWRDESGNGVVACSVFAESQRGAKVLLGKAQVVLPLKGAGAITFPLSQSDGPKDS